MHLTPATPTRAEPCDWSEGAPRSSQQCWGVTAGKARHNSSNVKGVTADKVRHNSSINITHSFQITGT